ncbi:WD domain, G-beta repeat-containing protein [Nostoc sp. PCC 7524]|uniref:WD domain, G-beta repeat-containing protein n=1 Tax=Nostoc sp. (strain ATCC 29411 / PCC 7524) TaxID=28072 RepID=UPI00029F0D18|nr:WD domain, G-beta repeat-containing protein [Nostoc sp. PCC 7524]AFY49106.1 WD domain, G-beta repeat-containing protein [Nostoc sp. PCC 7524]
MEQGLKLLTKLVVEFAPMVANLIQNQAENSLATSNYQLPKILKEFSQFINAPQATKSFSINSETAKVQHQLAVDQRETQLQVVNQEQETRLKLPEVYKILDNWPLRLYPAQILDSHTNNQRKPLKIFIVPLQVKLDQFNILNNKTSEIELILAEGLRKFLTQHYSLQSTIRATEFLAGAWYSKSFHDESSIKALFNVLKTEPILILESEIDGDYLNFRIAYWGIGQENYHSQQITRLPYKAIIQESVKSRALAWKEIRDKLLNLGENLEDIQQIGQDNIYNLEVLEKIEHWEQEGVDISKLSLKYQANHQDLEKLYPTLITCHSLVAAWIADVYYLVNYDVPPLLPELLPSLSADKLDLQLLQTIVAGYQQAYQGLDKNRRDLIPELTLQLAYSLSHLSDRTWVQAQVDYSISTWLELRQVSIQEFSHPLEAIASVIKIADEPYVQKLQAYFQAISDRQSILAVEKLLNIIAHLKQQPTQAIAHYSHTLTAHFSPIIAISANAEILVSGCADKTINVWNWQTGKQICTLGDKIEWH